MRKASTMTNEEQYGTQEVFSIDNFSLQSIGAYMIFSEINEDSSRNLCEFIIKANYVFPPDQPLTLLINSPGGSVYDGFGIIDLMKSSKLEIQTVGIGMIASMAALIFVAGTKGKRVMSKNSYLMTHQFFQAVEGRYHEFIAQRSHEDDLHNKFVKHFLDHTKLNEQQINEILLGSTDRMISAEQALEYGMCDVIQEPWD